MKLWIVLYINGALGATVGPLPYDMAECQRRLREDPIFLETYEKAKANNIKVRAECVESPTRP